LNASDRTCGKSVLFSGVFHQRNSQAHRNMTAILSKNLRKNRRISARIHYYRHKLDRLGF